MGTGTGSNLRARVEGSLSTTTDVADIADAVFAGVRAEIPFAFACLAVVDPANGLITRAEKSDPLDLGDQEFADAEYGEPDVNKFAEIALRPVPVGVLSVDTRGRPESARRLGEYMTPAFGFTDELRLACRAGRTMWGALALYRKDREPFFTARDGEALAGIHDVIAAALMRAIVAPGISAAEPVQTTVLVLDELDRVESTSSSVESLVAALGGWDHGALPAPLLAASSSARTAGEPITSRVRTPAGIWLSVRAVPVSTLAGVRATVLTVEAPPSAAIGRLRLAANGLTAREEEIVQQVLLGASTKEMASTLHLSAHTVQDHLKAVFAKLGIGSRRELIAQFVD